MPFSPFPPSSQNRQSINYLQLLPYFPPCDRIRPVCNGHVFDRHRYIIPQQLREHIFGQRDRGGFTFDHHPGLMGSVIYKNIKPFAQLAQLNFFFQRNKGLGVIHFLQQVLNKVLPHPFFRCQQEPLSPDRIKDKFLLIFFFDAKSRFGVIDR